MISLKEINFRNSVENIKLIICTLSFSLFLPWTLSMYILLGIEDAERIVPDEFVEKLIFEKRDIEVSSN